MVTKTLSQRFVAARWPDKHWGSYALKNQPRPTHLDPLANAVIDAAERVSTCPNNAMNKRLRELLLKQQDRAVFALGAALAEIEDGGYDEE